MEGTVRRTATGASSLFAHGEGGGDEVRVDVVEMPGGGEGGRRSGWVVRGRIINDCRYRTRREWICCTGPVDFSASTTADHSDRVAKFCRLKSVT